MPEWLNILIRSISLFFLVLLVARLIGKKQTSRMTLFDLITAIVVGVIAAANSLNLVDNLAYGLVALAVWVLFPIAISYLSIKSKTVRDIVQGKETVLINHGKVLEDKLMEVRYTPEDLLSQLRKKNVFNFADVEFAVLEPNGELSVLLKKDKQSISSKTMGLAVENESVPQTVILEGRIIDEALTAMRLNRNWLNKELEKAGVELENISIAQVDSTRQLYLDLYDDAIKTPKPKTKELALAALKSCQADCELYALGSKNQEAKKLFEESSSKLKEVTQELEPIIKN